MADRNIKKMTTPRGTFVWPKLVEPDYGSKEYPKPDGEYSVKVRFDAEDPAFIPFKKKIDAALEAAVENARAQFAELKPATRKKLGDISINEPFEVVYDEDENETGEVLMKFTMKAGGIVKKGPRQGKRWARKPQLFDAKGKPMLKAPEIWGGTVGKVSFSFITDGYFIPGTGATGIKLQLEAVQIIELVSGGQRQGSDFGFEEEEDGFEYDESQFEDEADDDSDNDEFGDAGADDEGAADF